MWIFSAYHTHKGQPFNNFINLTNVDSTSIYEKISNIEGLSVNSFGNTIVRTNSYMIHIVQESPDSIMFLTGMVLKGGK